MAQKALVMTFADANGNKTSLTINKPADTLTAAEISAQMDELVASNLITVNTGEGYREKIVAKSSAKYVTQTKTAVSVQ